MQSHSFARRHRVNAIRGLGHIGSRNDAPSGMVGVADIAILYMVIGEAMIHGSLPHLVQREIPRLLTIMLPEETSLGRKRVTKLNSAQSTSCQGAIRPSSRLHAPPRGLTEEPCRAELGGVAHKAKLQPETMTPPQPR